MILYEFLYRNRIVQISCYTRIATIYESLCLIIYSLYKDYLYLCMLLFMLQLIKFLFILIIKK